MAYRTELLVNSKLHVFKMLLLVMWLAVSMSNSSPLVFPNKIRMCGPMLVDFLNILCEGEFYDPSEDSSQRIRKRNVNAGNPQFDAYNDWIALSHRDNPHEISFQGPANQQKPQQVQRYKRGVTGECCRKTCSYSTMLSFCRQDK